MNNELQFEPFPRCSKCHTAYVVRRCLSLTDGWVWSWMNDCQTKTCGKNPPELAGKADAA